MLKYPIKHAEVWTDKYGSKWFAPKKIGISIPRESIFLRERMFIFALVPSIHSSMVSIYEKNFDT